MKTLTNRFKIAENFSLHEFQNKEGLVMVHPALVEGLQAARDEMNDGHEEYFIVVTNSIRTEADNAALGARLGWTDEGGLVARDSRHLTKYGGIAADISVRRILNRPVNRAMVLQVLNKHFDYVKADYADGHIHVDQRFRAR